MAFQNEEVPREHQLRPMGLQTVAFDNHAGSVEHPMVVREGRRHGRLTITSDTPGAPNLYTDER